MSSGMSLFLAGVFMASGIIGCFADAPRPVIFVLGTSFAVFALTGAFPHG